MPRIAFVLQYHHSRFVGGAEMQAWLLATEFARRGWEVHYVSASETAEPGEKDGIRLHSMPDEFSAWYGNGSVLQKILREIDPDVVYTRAFDMFTLCGVLAAAPRALTIWSAASRFDGRAWPYLLQGWKYQSPWHFIKRAPRHLSYNYIARKGRSQAKLVLAQTEEQRRDLAKLGISSELLRNSHKQVADVAAHKDGGRPVILWADSVKRLKRPEVFLELARRCKDLNAEFLMLGRIYDEFYKSAIETTAREAKNFRYGGQVSLEEVESYFASAHLHVKTSLNIEGFPNTFIQAWLHRVPVVSLEVDPDSLIMTHALGVCVPTIDELERSVRELVANHERRNQLADNAREFALNEFDLKKNVDKLEGLISGRLTEIQS